MPQSPGFKVDWLDLALKATIPPNPKHPDSRGALLLRRLAG
jgi:hypothetical protein